MEVEKKGNDDKRSFWCLRKSPREDASLDSSNSRAKLMEEKPGWKAVPYILGLYISLSEPKIMCMYNFFFNLYWVYAICYMSSLS